MNKFLIIILWIIGIIIALTIAGFIFYKFYLAPQMKIIPAKSQLQTKEIFDQDIIDSITKYTNENVRNSANISFAIIDSNQVNLYGLKRENNILTTFDNSDSLFQIGSISKVFTSTIFANLIVNQKIDPNKTIDKYLGFQLKNNLKIRIKDLSNHTSGLPRMPGVYKNIIDDFDQPYKKYTQGWLINYLKNEITIEEKQKGKVQYSNLGVSILGYIIAKSQDKTYDNLLSELVFKKFKMNQSFLYEQKHENIIVKSRDMTDSTYTINWVLNSFNPAGGIVSNIKDMSKFALAHFDSSNRELILQQQPTCRIDSNMQIGLGWHIINSKLNHKVLFHNGATSNFNSSMMIDLDSKKAIIILSNSSYSDTKGSLDKLATSILYYLNKKVKFCNLFL